MANGIDKRLQNEKERNILNDLIPKANKIKTDIESVNGIVIYPMLQPIGHPIINITKQNVKIGFWGRHIAFIYNKKIKSYESKLQEVIKTFYTECKNIGVIPIAKITENGAEMFYTLTNEKREEISPLVLPPNSNKSVLVPQGIGVK